MRLTPLTRYANPAPQVTKQIYVGDEEFEEAVQRQIKKTTNRQVRHPLRRIVQAVSEVMGKNEEIAGRQRSEEIKRMSRIGLLFGEKAWRDGIGGVAAISAGSRVVDGELGGEAGRDVACTGTGFSSPAGEGFRRAGLIY